MRGAWLVVLDIEESTGKIEQQFIPFASRNLYAIPVDITGCGTTMDILQRMQEQERKAGHSSRSLIKFELTGKVDVQSWIFWKLSLPTAIILSG